MTTLLLALAIPAHAEEYWIPGATIHDAASVQLTKQGLDDIAGLAPGLVPGEFAIPDQTSDAYSFTGGWAGVEIDDVRLVPSTDALTLEAELEIRLNDASDKFHFSYDVGWLDGECSGYVAPFPARVTAPISLDVVLDGSGEPYVDATLGEIVITHDLRSSHLRLDGDCLTDFEDVLNAVGLSVYDFVIDRITPVLQNLVQSYRGEIESQIESALAAARFSDVIDVAGIPLSIDLLPSDVLMSPGGVEVLAAGRMSAPVDPCVSSYGVPGSLRTATPPPAITSNPASTQAALHLSDDVANQALYALWNGGLLCYTLSEDSEEISLPVPLNTALLGLLAEDHFEEIVGEDEQPLVIRTAPYTPPRVDYQGAHDVEVAARDLDLDFYTEVDHRQARALGITVSADVGIDVGFDPVTGIADVAVDLGQGAVSGEATHVELTPDARAEIEESFAGLVDTLMGQLLGDALDDLVFALPSAQGMGLTALDLGPTGGGDWLGGHAEVGAVTYGGGSDDEGCGGGCAVGGGQGGAPWLVVLAVPLLRRRR